MSNVKQTGLFLVISPLLKFSEFFGVSPFEMTFTNGRRRLQRTKSVIVRNGLVCFTIVFLSSIEIALSLKLYKQNNVNWLPYTIFRLGITFDTTLSVTNIFKMSMNGIILKQIVKRFIEIDALFKNIGIKSSFDSSKALIRFQLIVLPILTVGILATGSVRTSSLEPAYHMSHVLMFFLCYLFMAINYLAVVHIVSLISFLERRFTLINSSLLKCVYNNPYSYNLCQNQSLISRVNKVTRSANMLTSSPSRSASDVTLENKVPTKYASAIIASLKLLGYDLGSDNPSHPIKEECCRRFFARGPGRVSPSGLGTMNHAEPIRERISFARRRVIASDLERTNHAQPMKMPHIYKSTCYLVNGIQSRKHRECERINKLSHIHSSLCDLAEHINATFALQILLVTFSLFVNFENRIQQTYFTFIQSNINHYVHLCIQGFFLTYFSFVVVLMVTACSKAASQANHTGVVVHELLLQTNDPRERLQLKLFSLQVLHRKLEFTAFGLFPLDETLLSTMVAAVSTYMVILVQFKSAT